MDGGARNLRACLAGAALVHLWGKRAGSSTSRMAYHVRERMSGSYPIQTERIYRGSGSWANLAPCVRLDGNPEMSAYGSACTLCTGRVQEVEVTGRWLAC